MLSIVKSVYLTSTRHETSVTTNAEERTASSWLCAPPCPRTACGCLNSKKSTWETPFEKLRERQGFFGLSFLKKKCTVFVLRVRLCDVFCWKCGVWLWSWLIGSGVDKLRPTGLIRFLILFLDRSIFKILSFFLN